MADFEGNERLRIFRGKQEYGRARRKGVWDVAKRRLMRQVPHLLRFKDVVAHHKRKGGINRGLQNVPLERIKGSVGKHYAFTHHFYPTKRVDEDRWSRVYAQVTSSQGLPPVDLYKVGDMYFVVDGNHRVSIARHIGAKTIEAYVTEFRACGNEW